MKRETGNLAGADGPRVYINGQPRQLEHPINITTLLAELGLKGRLAVEINGCVVPRGRHLEQRLRDADRIEIVRAIGGG